MKVEIHFAINVRKKYKKNSNLQKFILNIYKTIEYFLQNNKKYLEKLK